MTVAPPYLLALRMMERGVKEVPGTKTNWLVAAMNWLSHGAANEDDPWCGSGMHFCHWLTGHQSPKNPSSARAWTGAGTPVETHLAQRGDVVVLWREQREGWKGHVAFFHAWADAGKTRLVLLGGNQSDGWTLSTFPVSRVLGVRRPLAVWNPQTYLASLSGPVAATTREV